QELLTEVKWPLHGFLLQPWHPRQTILSIQLHSTFNGDCTLDQLDRQSSSPNLIELGEPRISASLQREVPPNLRTRGVICDSPQHNGGSISPASTSGASMPLRDSPGASSTASDSPTPKNNLQDSHWHGLEERCQLLGTEEESSDRHSSASDTDQDDASWSPWIITTEQRDYYCAQFRALQPDVNGLISGPEARCFFEKSRLSLPELRKIWQLADVTKDGALSLEEFKTAMHLVVLRRNNIDLPDKLPPSLIPSVPPLAPLPLPPSKPNTGEKQKPASDESLALCNASPPQADITSPQKGKDVSKWTKFMDSPTSSVSSPGPKPVNFDFHKSAVEQDPKILHPIALRLTPESQNLTASGDDAVDPCRSPRRLTSDTVHEYDSIVAPPDIRPIQRPQPKKPAGPGAIPPPPSQAAVMSSSEGTSISGFSISGPTSLPMGLKKDPPPPPPPRPHRTHARSSSLDLNRLDASSGKNIALLGAPPIVPPRISPSTMTSRKLMVQHSEGADPLHQGFADFTQFENQSDLDAFPLRHGAFEVYRPTPKNTAVTHENVDVEDGPKTKSKRTVVGEKMSFLQLQEKNAALVRTCHLLSLELAEVQTEKAELEIQLERLRASLPR
ncbi:RalBP1-associated Eps domain-containing protein 1, partial [Frankliniella fusca]